jgi:hypothetical protein
MKPFRLVVDVVMFAAGAGAGVYWGVNHPTQAVNVEQHERVEALKVKVAAEQAKIEVLQKFGKDSTDAQAALSDAQTQLDQAKQELAGQAAPQ